MAALLLQPRPKRTALLLTAVGTMLQGVAGQAAQPRRQQVGQVLCAQCGLSAALLEVKHSALPVLCVFLVVGGCFIKMLPCMHVSQQLP